jgi:hypothetical protein
VTTEQTARTTAFYDAIDAFQRTHRLPGLQHAQIRGMLAEHLARAIPAAAPAVSLPVSRAAVERVVAYRSPGTRALYCVTCARQESGWKPATAEVQDDTVCDFCGECVLAVAAPAVSLPVSRAAVLREAAEVADGLTPTKNVSWYDSLEDAWNEGTWAVAAELRRMADEEQPAAACICTEDAWPPHCPCRADEYRAAAAAPAGTEETRRG